MLDFQWRTGLTLHRCVVLIMLPRQTGDLSILPPRRVFRLIRFQRREVPSILLMLRQRALSTMVWQQGGDLSILPCRPGISLIRMHRRGSSLRALHRGGVSMIR